MKVFISADIEGTAVTATREGCRPGEFEYERSRKEMTAEVVAAAEGARAAGAELVVVKDAHGPGLNILPEELPEYVQLIRSWSGSPEMMVEGLDSSFDAAFFVGYHNAAGEGGNALSHTINGGVVHRITVNGAARLPFPAPGEVRLVESFRVVAVLPQREPKSLVITASWQEAPPRFLITQRDPPGTSPGRRPQLALAPLARQW